MLWCSRLASCSISSAVSEAFSSVDRFLTLFPADNLTNARSTFGITYAIARSSALVLHVDVAFLLLPVCRNFITMIRRTPLNDFIPFDAK